MDDHSSSRFGLARIGQMDVPVRDVDPATAFYRDTLGMRVLFQAPPGGAPNLQAARETLAARGVVFEADPHRIAKLPDHDLWMALFRDADDNLLALMSEIPTVRED